MSELKRTQLYDVHVQAGATMVDFGGWEMPIQYPSGIVSEHLYTRHACSLFDVLVANTGDPENYLRENWYSTSANNTSGYANSEVDRLLDQLASEFDSNARRDLVMQIQQEIMDDAATVFFGYETTYLFYNNRVTGVTMYPMDYYWLTKDVKLAA